MPVDSERKKYGPDIKTMGAKCWLSQQSMQAYSLWMAWLYQSDPEVQDDLAKKQTPDDRRLVRRAYEMGEEQAKNGGRHED